MDIHFHISREKCNFEGYKTKTNTTIQPIETMNITRSLFLFVFTLVLACQAKAKEVYRKVSIAGGIFLAFQGLLPAIPLLLWGGLTGHLEWLVFAPCLVMYFLYLKIWHTLRGYTGDCCGAMFLLVELTVYLTAAITLCR